MTAVRHRYERCICQRGVEVDAFISGYLSNPGRQILLIAGAGFDPRSAVVCQSLAGAACRVRGVFLREKRPVAPPECHKRAQANADDLRRLVRDCNVETLPIFADDGAVIGGRRAALLGQRLDLRDVTDIIVDFSALSKGVGFPLVRLLLSRIEREQPATNLHVMVTDEAITDDEIVDTSSDKVMPIHGFQGGLAPAQSGGAAILWLPQLTFRQREALSRIFRYVKPHDVCPVLPFPCSDPRAGDKLAEHYQEEFESVWSIDPRNIVYASEGSPLDLYQTVLRLDAARRRVFSEVGGSVTVLSPIGSKVTSIGILMAAIDKDFPVVYVESLSYEVDFASMDARRGSAGDLVHVWLHGEAYAGV